MKKYGLKVVIIFAGILTSSPVNAALSISTFYSWTVWTDSSNGQKICYISSNPTRSEPTNVRRGPVHFIVTIRPYNRTDVSTILGYPTNEQHSNATAEVDGHSFALTTQSDSAWLAKIKDEKSFMNFMRKGMTLKVKAKSQRGTNTIDIYSLRGVTAAYDRATRECPKG